MDTARGRTFITDLWNDLVVTLRALRRAPQLTTAVVLTLALGIGASSAIVSVVDAVLLRPSPFEDPQRLVMVWETDRGSDTSHEPASWPDVLDLRERSHTLSAVGSMNAVSATLTGTGGEPERIAALGVTPGLPEMLGVHPIRGRLFDPSEDGEGADGAAGGPGVALLAEDFWRQRFAADPGVIGSTIELDGRPVTVVGVLPADADLGIPQAHAKADYAVPLAGPDVQVWLAMVPSVESSPRQTHPFLTVGRLAPGASLETAQGELTGIMADLEDAYPENADRGAHLEPYDLVTFGPVRPALLVLLGAAAMVLLVACVNVANLMLARSTVRSRELAVRRALGGGWGRIARQFLVESAALTTLGTAAALALAFGGLRLLVALAPGDIPRLGEAAIDLRVLAFTAAVAVATAAVFGLAPLARSRRLDLQGELRAQAGRAGATAREPRRFRAALVVAEVALAVALVIGAGVLLRSVWTLSGVDPGFRTVNVTKLQYQLPENRYPVDYSLWPNLPAISGFHSELLRQARALPGVEAAAIASRHPLDPGFTNSFTVVGREAEARDWPEIRCRFVTPGYLETMDLTLLDGRELNDGDVAGRAPVAMINRAAAERYFTGRDPLGQQIRFWGTPWRIVGVIGDERFLGLAEDPEPAVYASLLQAPQSSGVLLVRTAGDPLTSIEPLRRIVHRLDPQVALYGVEPLEATVAESIARPRFTAALLGLFGAVAILLALVGVHGVLSYTVAQRAPELAVRMALGATRRNVLALVLRDGATLAAIGTAIGLAIAFAGAHLLRSLVYGVAPRDAVTFAAVAAGVMVLAAVASWLPARRASATDPNVTLRSE